jgi:hypothetical protein
MAFNSKKRKELKMDSGPTARFAGNGDGTIFDNKEVTSSRRVRIPTGGSGNPGLAIREKPQKSIWCSVGQREEGVARVRELR